MCGISFVVGCRLTLLSFQFWNHWIFHRIQNYYIRHSKDINWSNKVEICKFQLPLSFSTDFSIWFPEFLFSAKSSFNHLFGKDIADSKFQLMSQRRGRARRRWGDDEEDCAICLIELSTRSETALTCGHSFHDSCLRKWLRKNRSCPMCRNRYKPPERDRTLSPICLHNAMFNWNSKLSKLFLKNKNFKISNEIRLFL